MTVSQGPESCPSPGSWAQVAASAGTAAVWIGVTIQCLLCHDMEVINEECRMGFGSRYDTSLKASISAGRGLLISYSCVETDANVLFPCYLYTLIYID